MTELNGAKFTVVRQNAHISNEHKQLESVLNTPVDLGICVEKPRFPQYALSSTRMKSFEKWPDYLPFNKKDLVEARLVYTGVGDNVRCYHCGGGLRNWKREDVPMEEHAKWYPRCPHVLLVKGQEYVDKVGRGERPEIDCGINPKVQEEVQKIDLMQTLAAQSCLEMGFSDVLLKQAINVFVAKNGKDMLKISLRVTLRELFDVKTNIELKS